MSAASVAVFLCIIDKLMADDRILLSSNTLLTIVSIPVPLHVSLSLPRGGLPVPGHVGKWREVFVRQLLGALDEVRRQLPVQMLRKSHSCNN